MEISKLIYKGNAIDGTSHREYGSVKRAIIKWMQQHPDKCKHTTIEAMITQAGRDLDIQKDSIRSCLTRGKRQGWVDWFGTKYSKTIRVNYFHPSLPQEVIDNAPEEEKNHILEVFSRAEEKNGTVGASGEITTVEDSVEPSAPDTAPVELPIITEDRTIKEETEQALPVEEQTLPVEVKQTKHGTQITFTININL